MTRGYGARSLRAAATALRDADAGGSLFLDEGHERVPWQAVARWLDERARLEDEDVPAWIDVALRTRGDGAPTCLSLAHLLADDEAAPPALRRIASAYLETRLVNGPRSRSADPETSHVSAAASLERTSKPGGTVHRILKAYRAVDLDGYAILDDAGQQVRVSSLTAREVEDGFAIRAAHKRTSELLRAGLLTVVREGKLDEATEDYVEVDLVRDGGRVLAITRAGHEEAARLDALERVEA